MKLLHYIPYLAIFLCRGNVSFFLPLLHARIQRGPTQTMFFFSGVGGGGGGVGGEEDPNTTKIRPSSAHKRNAIY